MDIKEILIRVLFSVIVGGIFGFEREYTNSSAGFRTHILVALGACMISLIQVNILDESLMLIANNETLTNVLKVDMGRLGAQVVSGIGFLGAGTILHTKGSIKGLTTAATIWVVGCIGLAIGLGYYKISIVVALTSVIVLVVFRRIEKRLIWKKDISKIHIEFLNRKQTFQTIEEEFVRSGIKIINIEFNIADEFNNNEKKTCILTVSKSKEINLCELMLKCSQNENILNIYEIVE